MNDTLQALKECIDIMSRLRDPNHGCAWDLAQTHESIASHGLEEVFELIHAIDEKNDAALCEELGDVLLQVLFHAELAKNRFGFKDVAEHLRDKLIRRHPHVFGDSPTPPAEQKEADIHAQWERIKSTEAKPANHHFSGSPWRTARKLGIKASKIGLDWPTSAACLETLKSEVEESISASDNKEALKEELSDVFFTLFQICRLEKLDPVALMQSGNTKFHKRFSKAKPLIEDGMDPEEAWEKIK